MIRQSSNLAASIVIACLLIGGQTISSVRAQAADDDPYEDNDTIEEATSLPVTTVLSDTTIHPSGDLDFWRVLAQPGQLSVVALGTPGLDLNLSLYGPAGEVIETDNIADSPNANLSYEIPEEGYYVIEVDSVTEASGWYELRLTNPVPTPTPTITPTSTAKPTSTATQLPTHLPDTAAPATATPNLGGAPDIAEPNYDFATAYRITPGDRLPDLNFNPGVGNGVDNDFFVMAVRKGVTYTCRTEDLGQGVDTNMILYHSATFDDLINGNDDVDPFAGQINSAVTFTAREDTNIYVLVGYKYPAGVRLPGNATYALTCFVAIPTPVPAPMGGSSSTPTPDLIEQVVLLSTPQREPTTTPVPVQTQTIDIVIAYDRNANDEVDADEGVRGMSVRVVDPASNLQLAGGFTGNAGSLRLLVASNHAVRVTVPYLNAAEDFRPGSPVQWTLLIPAANAPGLIP